MGKGMRLWHLTGLPLQMVIPDHPRRIQGFLKIALFHQPFDVRRPDPRKTIGHQLKPHGQGIRLNLRGLLPHPSHLRQGADLILHMVGDLMCDHIGCREIALGPKTLVQRAEKAVSR